MRSSQEKSQTVAGYLFLFIFRTVDLRKKYNMKFDLLKIISYIGILLAMCAICWQRIFILNCINILISFVFCFAINRKLICKVSKMVFKKISK